MQFVACSESTIVVSVARCGTTNTAYLNLLADWNADGDWNDALSCGPSQCAPEWAVRNHAFVLPGGCSQVTSPVFRVGPRAGESWMRITVTDEPVPDDFPWNGSTSMPNQSFASGETEDYPVLILAGFTSVGPGASGAAVQLQSAYPNPAHGATRLRFRLAREAVVTLAIYSSAGRRLRTLLRGLRPSGEHEVQWEGSDDGGRSVPPGLYVVRLEALGRVESHKLVWLGRR
jgi:hypothetical protein